MTFALSDAETMSDRTSLVIGNMMLKTEDCNDEICSK